MPRGRHWHLVPSSPSLAKSITATAAWTGTQFVYPYSSCPITGGDLLCVPRSGAATTFDPSTGDLTKLPSSLVLGGDVHWTGRALLAVDPASGKGVAFDPETHRWRRLPTGPTFTPFGLISVWAGRQLIEWGGVTSKPAVPGAALVAGQRTGPD